MSLRVVSLALFATAFANPSDKTARDTCNPCNPPGATASNPPSVGPDLKSLFVDVLASVKDIHFDKRWSDSVEPRDDVFCCAETLDCVKVQNLNIPMCYDKFTTNFAFSDRSYGSLTTGEYTQGDSEANLLTGQYSNGDKEGNIYAEDPEAKPNTATLSIPPQWTASGVGSAIPPTAIVGSATATAQASAQTTATSSGQSSDQTSATTGTGSEPSQSTGASSSTGDQSSVAESATPSHGAAAQSYPETGTSLVVSLLTALVYTLYDV